MHALKFADSMLFLSTLSLRRATINQKKNQPGKSFLSTLSLRRATLYLDNKTTQLAISIHALLAESDIVILRKKTPPQNFYPRSPCGERLETFCQVVSSKLYFYPRSPCGERRGNESREHTNNSNFYPRSPCGERH